MKMCVECEMKGSGLGGGPCGDLERGCGGGLSGTWVGRGDVVGRYGWRTLMGDG